MGGGRNKMEGGVLFQIPLKLGGGRNKKGWKIFFKMCPKWAKNAIFMRFWVILETF